MTEWMLPAGWRVKMQPRKTQKGTKWEGGGSLPEILWHEHETGFRTSLIEEAANPLRNLRIPS